MKLIQPDPTCVSSLHQNNSVKQKCTRNTLMQACYPIIRWYIRKVISRIKIKINANKLQTFSKIIYKTTTFRCYSTLSSSQGIESLTYSFESSRSKLFHSNFLFYLVKILFKTIGRKNHGKYYFI